LFNILYTFNLYNILLLNFFPFSFISSKRFLFKMFELKSVADWRLKYDHRAIEENPSLFLLKNWSFPPKHWISVGIGFSHQCTHVLSDIVTRFGYIIKNVNKLIAPKKFFIKRNKVKFLLVASAYNWKKEKTISKSNL